MEKVIICAQCGEEISLDEAIKINGNYYCDDCVVYCEHCGEYVLKDEAVYVDLERGYVCDDCLDNDYTKCDNCGEYVPNDEIYITYDGDSICQECYESYYSTCDDCGEIYPVDELNFMDDGCAYCDDCYSKHCHNIQDYHSFSAWHNYTESSSDNPIMKGFELEVQADDQCADDLKYFLDDFAVYEHDGSIYDGFEIITNPFSREWLNKNHETFKRMFNVLNEYEFDDENCGLHIHVSRKPLATSELSSDDVIDNILVIMETFKDELVKFSRRSYGEIEEWCQFLIDDSHITIDKIKDEKNGDRYHALNLRNSKTIEFRIFKQAHNFEQLMAALELVDNLVDIARSGKLDGLTWNHIVNYGGEFIQDYNNSLNITSDKELVIADLTKEKSVDINDHFEIGDVVEITAPWSQAYKHKAVIVEKDDYHDVVLVAVENYDGYSGNSSSDKYKETQFAKHMWYTEKQWLKHLTKEIRVNDNLPVGTRVLVRQDLFVSNSYGGDTFVSGMENMCGKIATIGENNVAWNREEYRLVGNNYYWTNAMFECAVRHVNINDYLY